ncbi:MAG TPA: tetratricopeptide repeat protein [Bacteroidales bacterium]|mgnify:CR=1 FL=1|nr:tetratricopeptide repeat protein [Bacteroidales bacterium]HOX79077.1 tetratricopeptide repeat protein [Bacteroidales bacterium]HPI85415.1 tetratricopeptide repeat protein [Bacteroidales bacterium]HPM93127.1 tetratricopeptide repeat protein [Bacteroidales bacterium]
MNRIHRQSLFIKSFICCLLLIVSAGLRAVPEDGKTLTDLITRAESLVESDPGEAKSLLRIAAARSDPKRFPKQTSRINFLLGEASFYLDDPDSVIAYYLKAVEIDVASGNDRTAEHINILGNLGYMYDLIDQKQIAIDFYQKALNIAREINQKDEIAANLANIAQLKTLQGFYEEAMLYMEEALAFDKESGDESIIAIDLNTIGRIYESMGMYAQAVSYLEQALEIDLRLKNEDKVAIRYNSLGLVYKGWGKYNMALEYFGKALEIDQKLGREEKVALRQANIGSTLIESGEVDRAIAYLEESLDYFKTNDRPSYTATTLNDLGRGYFMKKDYAKAEKLFLESANICRQYGFVRFRMNSLDYLSRLYRESGQYQKAYLSISEFNVLNDSIFNAESQKKIAEFNAKYELDKEQQENELLRRDREISRKRHTVAILAFSLAGLVLALFLLAVLVRLKTIQNRRLRAEKENERLRMDLEQKNKELTYNAMCIIKNNETVAKIAETLEDAIQAGQDERGINNLVRKLQNMEREKNWTEFEVRFTKVHEDFYRKLNERFPDLTPNEKKLCAFLKLNMSTKDIAAITHQSVHSINVARTRMRKKLGIDGTDENLIGFLNSL